MLWGAPNREGVQDSILQHLLPEWLQTSLGRKRPLKDLRVEVGKWDMPCTHRLSPSEQCQGAEPWASAAGGT